jgi:SNF2 family DNA or RNA helicase
MGLGETIQALALLLRDRANGVDRPARLVCPTPVLGNWRKEAARFAPDLPVLVHGLAHTRDQEFAEQTVRQALVISCYVLADRDFELLKEVAWSGIARCESLTADYRIALTGTPVENSVGELWSIMDFLNLDFLGNQTEFSRRFLLSIQKRADSGAVLPLRKLTAPFIRRRLKTCYTGSPEKRR